MSKCKPATKAEIAWCKRLEKVLKAHPKRLWLFAGDGILNVMKYPQDGEEHENGLGSSVDGDNSIYCYNSSIIIADGGGW